MSSVEHYVNTRVVSRDSKASVLEVAKAMADWSISSVAITDEEEEEGNKKVVGSIAFPAALAIGFFLLLFVISHNSGLCPIRLEELL
jgi:hypothetical protein